MTKNTMLKSDAAMMLLAEKDAHQRTLDALANLRKQLHEHFKMNVRKHYSLLCADAAAGTILYEATLREIEEAARRSSDGQPLDTPVFVRIGAAS